MENRKTSRKERYERYLYDNDLEDTYVSSQGSQCFFYFYHIYPFCLYEFVATFNNISHRDCMLEYCNSDYMLEYCNSDHKISYTQFYSGKLCIRVVPPRILLHKKNTKGLKVFLWISCIYSLMSQQVKMYGTSQ